MYVELTRSMNADERALLSEIVTGTDPPVSLVGTAKWVFIWFGGMILCALAASGLILLGINPVIGGIIGGALAITAIICLYAIIMLISGHYHWSHYHRDFIRLDIPSIRAALEDGNVFVKKVSAAAVIEIVEFEDEGPGYIYDVSDGKVLFLKGQRFYPVSEDMPWPNADFEIVRTVHDDRWVGIFCSGRELTAVRKIPSSSCVEHVVWADREELMDGTIEEFAESITKVA